MKFTTVFFDLDDTLYPSSSGLWQAIKERMNRYMHEKLGIPPESIPRLQEQFFRQHGTTLRGLEAHYPVDRDDFLAYVHDFPLEEYLSPDPILRQVLTGLSTRKLVFTNADASHARRVLAALQLGDCFDEIVDVNAVQPYCKPHPEAFTMALKIAGEAEPQRCAMIDDLPSTTRAAREIGLFSILFGRNEPSPEADAVLNDWRDLPILLNGRTR
jgi:pyrimidine 5'-nucleotidase